MKKIYLTIPLLAFVIDRTIKYFAPSINFEGGFVRLGFYKNYAGAFSLPIDGVLYNIAGIILLAIFIYLFFKEIKKVHGLQVASYAFIIFGGVSNTMDRLSYGYTIDYINLFNFSFFNLADGMLVAGAGVLLVHQVVLKKEHRGNDEKY